MSKQTMTNNLKLAFIGLAVAVATLLALPMAADQAHAAAPPEKRDFFGTVLTVDVHVIQVSLADDTVVDVTVTENTVIRLPLKENAQLTDLFEGDTVAVSLTDDLSYASKIFVIPGKTQFRHVPGDITSVTDDSLTLQPLAPGSEPIVFNIGLDTEIKYRAGATEMVEGVFAVVLTRRNPLTGELSPDALEIHVTASQSRPQPTDARPVKPEPEAEPENEAKITGIFEGLDDDGNWLIGERTVTTDGDTEIDSGIVVGQRVKVEGILLDSGDLLAREIETVGDSGHHPNRARIEGVFEGLDDDGNWIVGGNIVIITDDTDTDGEPFVGQRVIIVGTTEDQQTFIAREVENIVEARTDETSQSRARSVKLEGVYEGVNDIGDWIVNGMEISVDRLTRLEGTPEIGSTVEIKGVLRDGKIVALKIEFEDSNADFGGASRNRVTLHGPIDAMSEDGSVISVDSHRVHISDLTETDGELAVGVIVRLLAFIRDDGTLVAKEIDVRDQRATDDGDGIEADEEDTNRIDGVIEIINDDGSFVVNGITIIVPEHLTTDRVLTEGLEIRVYGIFQDDGSLLANRIRGGETDEKKHDEEERISGVIEEVVIEDGVVIAIVVDGRTIHVQPLTEIDSSLRPGVKVKIEVIVNDLGLVAREIDEDRSGRRGGITSGETLDRRDAGRPDVEVDDDMQEIDGIVIGLSDRRVVLASGQSIAINGDTKIEGELFIGAKVEIRLYMNDAGILVAMKIEVSRPGNSGRGGTETGGKVDGGEPEEEPARDAEVEEGVDVDEADTVEDEDADEGDETDEQDVEEPEDTDEKDESNEEIKLDGIVRDFSSTRLILRNNQRVLINRSTEIDGTLYEGADVEIKATRRADGTLVAFKIKVESRPDDDTVTNNSGSGSREDPEDDQDDEDLKS